MPDASMIPAGATFGRLVVIMPAPTPAGIRRQRRHYLCGCRCGALVVVRGDRLAEGRRTSCGCSVPGRAVVPHGMTDTPTWTSWRKMKARCLDPADVHWKDYGGRGITVADRWLGPEGFVTFLADMGERPAGMTLDRVDVEGNYEPANCRWADAVTQANNKRRRR